MIRMQLISHASTPMPQVKSLAVALSATGDGGLAAHFDCRCGAGVLRLPHARPAQAADELWRHTCCELFAGVFDDAAYREFNCSPSGQWAMYGFSDNRVRDSCRLDLTLPMPRIIFASGAEGWTLDAWLEAAALPRGPAEKIQLSAAVVLEAADGSLSYWALQHVAAQPDFHRRESFALRLSDLA